MNTLEDHIADVNCDGLDPVVIASALRKIDRAGRDGIPRKQAVALIEQATRELNSTIVKPTAGAFSMSMMDDGWDDEIVETPMLDTGFVTKGGKRLLYKGLAWIAAQPGTAKSLISTAQMLQVARGGGKVVMLDLESTKDILRIRLKQLGATQEEAKAISYVRPEGSWTPNDLAATFKQLEELLKKVQPDLFIIDGFAVLLSRFGLEENDNTEIVRIADLLTRLADDLSLATLVIDHMGKISEGTGGNSRYARGGSAKLAAPAIMFRLDVVKSPSLGNPGKVKVVLTKDRHGQVGGIGDTACWITFTPNDRCHGGVDIELLDGDDKDATFFFPFRTYRAIAEHVKLHGTASATDIRSVAATAGSKRDADTWSTPVMDDLITFGYVKLEREGARKNYIWVDAEAQLTNDALDSIREHRLALSKGENPGVF